MMRHSSSPALLAVAAFALLFVLPRGAAATEVREVTSPGGITAWLVEDHANPVVSMRITFRGGAALDPEGREGLANLVSSTLDEGAGELDSEQFQRQLEDSAITLRFEAGKDRFSGRLHTLTQNLDRSAQLLNLALTRPRFDDEPVGRIKSQIAASIRRNMERPGDIAAKAFFKNMFPNHGYARPSEGTEQGIAAITQSDLKGFVARRLSRDNLVIGVAGDISADDLAAFLDKAFDGLPQTAAAKAVEETTANATGRMEVIERPVPQSVILFGHGGIKRDDPDYYAALVVNHILGGGSFTSRIYNEVREKRGLAYSAGSSIYPFDHAGLVIGQAGTENAAVGETIAVIRDEWRKMAASGVTEAELADAKTYITGAFPLRFTSSSAIAGIMVAMQLNNLGIDYIDRRNDYIAAVDLTTASRVARELLDVKRLDFVVVGQPTGLQADIQEGLPESQ